VKIRRLALGKFTPDYDLAEVTDAPNNVLEKIVWHKQAEVLAMAETKNLDRIITELDRAPNLKDFRGAILKSKYRPALIAEVKKASPSKGVIRQNFDPVAIAQTYAKNGAACLSVLTDAEFFQGSFENLQNIHKVVDLPLLCKEFIISEYQIYLARSCGADAVLLITAILSDADLIKFAQLIYELGMTALIEVHTEPELARILSLSNSLQPTKTLIGINNRNLETFSVDLAVTKALIANLPSNLRDQWLWVSESGIHTPEDLAFVAQSGAIAVLVGESLLKQTDMGLAINSLYANSVAN
jgi:indole-3-glycerol phosphate synthase